MVAHKIRRIQKRLTVTVGWVGFLPTTYATKIDLTSQPPYSPLRNFQHLFFEAF